MRINTAKSIITENYKEYNEEVYQPSAPLSDISNEEDDDKGLAKEVDEAKLSQDTQHNSESISNEAPKRDTIITGPSLHQTMVCILRRHQYHIQLINHLIKMSKRIVFNGELLFFSRLICMLLLYFEQSISFVSIFFMIYVVKDYLIKVIFHNVHKSEK